MVRERVGGCKNPRVYLSSGTLKFGKIDVTEEQFCVISLYVIGAVFGSDIWNLEVRSLRAGSGYRGTCEVTMRQSLSPQDFGRVTTRRVRSRQTGHGLIRTGRVRSRGKSQVTMG